MSKSFENTGELVDLINNALGEFCNEFGRKRKELAGLGKAPTRGILFKYIDTSRVWAINEGGGTELQYHLAFDPNSAVIRYGLGFNTEYVQFKNEFKPVEYVRPFMIGFTNIQKQIEKILPDYHFVIGDINQLKNPKENEYTLFGKTIKVNSFAPNFEIEDSAFDVIIDDLKRQLEAYRLIFEEKNKLNRVPMNVQNSVSVLLNKKQIILQGPPGTGKTYTAKDIAEQMIFDKVSEYKNEQKEALESSGRFKLIQFHPAYSYEDFVRGIVAKSEDNQINYVTKNKLLAEFAKKALEDLSQPYVLIIDEINRANLPAVLGELIYALEYRGEKVESMYATTEEGNTLVLPPNLYIIGTMNTSDRSVGHIDYAIRRRFAFIDVLPKVLDNNFEASMFEKVSALFIENFEAYKGNPAVILKRSKHLLEEFRPEDVWLGHSYFINKEGEDFSLRLKYEIIPILKEYVKDGILKESALDEINKL